MTRALRRKLLRDLRTFRGQLAAIALIMACGVASFVCVLTAYEGLQRSRDAYYAAYRMPDVFAPCKKAPATVVRRLAAIPGVRRTRARIVFDVTLDLPDVDEPASGRMVSLPDGHRPSLGDVHLVRGRWFEGDGNRQVIVAKGFAEAHGLDVGDRVHAIMNNRKEALTIVAVALSPEHVYMVRGGGEFLPDPAHFSVLWISDSFAEAVFDFESSCNEVVATIDQGARIHDVLAAFDRELDRYGALSAYGREDQLSHNVLSDEIQGLRGTALFVPTVFLGVASFVLNVLMARLARTQRTQISVFRAFGYSRRQLVAYYLALVLVVGAAGAGLGVALGLWFAQGMVKLYAEFYSFPLLAFGVEPAVVLGSVGVTFAAAALGAVTAVREVTRLQPAEGLRPESPPTFRRTLVERWDWLWARLGFTGRMVLRGLARTRLRTLVSVAGVALATSMMLLTLYGKDATDALFAVQFEQIELHDVRVTFHEERGEGALREIRSLRGVRSAEPELMVPVRLRNGHRERRTALTGLRRDHELRRLRDADGRRVPLPEHGLLLSRKLAEVLDVPPGGMLDVEVLNGRKQHLRLPVTRLLDDYLGSGAYADIRSVTHWIDEEAVLTGAVLLVDPDHAATLNRELKELPAVAGVVFKGQTLQVLEDTMAASQAIMNTVLVLFAGAIAFGVLYNAARIGLAEKQRALASMEVMGFTQRETAGVLVQENLLIAAAAVPPGLGLGVLFCWALSRAYDTELYRFPFELRAHSVLAAVALVAVFALLANAAVWRRLTSLDMVEVLKARE